MAGAVSAGRLFPVGDSVFLAVAIVSDQPARPGSIVSWYDKMIRLFLTYLLMIIMVVIGLMLLVLPGIYLAVAYQLALPLAADKDLGPWQALEASRRTVTPKWFIFFTLWFTFLLALALSTLAFGIPLIWTVPLCVLAIGIVYRDAVGAEPATLQRVA